MNRNSQDQNESINSQNLSRGKEEFSFPNQDEHMRLSHITEENIQRSNAKSGFPNSRENGFESHLSQSKIQESGYFQGDLKNPNNVDKNESFQIIDSKVSIHHQPNKNSIIQKYVELSDFTLYNGPVDILGEGDKMRFCGPKVLDVLDINQITQVNNSNGLLNITGSEEFQMKNRSRLSKFSRELGSQNFGMSSGSLVYKNNSGNLQDSRTIKKISINHGSKNNSFVLNTSANQKRFSLINNNISKESGVRLNNSRNSSNSRHIVTFRKIPTGSSVEKKKEFQVSGFKNNYQNKKINSTIPIETSIFKAGSSVFVKDQPRRTIIKRVENPGNKNYLSERRVSNNVFQSSVIENKKIAGSIQNNIKKGKLDNFFK